RRRQVDVDYRQKILALTRSGGQRPEVHDLLGLLQALDIGGQAGLRGDLSGGQTCREPQRNSDSQFAVLESGLHGLPPRERLDDNLYAESQVASSYATGSAPGSHRGDIVP